ncbi:hypothetical protein ACWGPZ_26780 [Priestia megaterium]
MEFPVVLIKLNDVNTLENVLEKILHNNNRDARPDKGEWPTGDLLKKRWEPIVNGIPIDITVVPFSDEENFRYIYLNACVERAKSRVKDSEGSFLDRQDRINYVDENVLFFENGTDIYLAVYKSFSSYAQTKINYILKDLLFEEEWGSHEILPIGYGITDDVYYWMLRKVITGEKTLSNAPLITVETFTGYSSAGLDNAHRVKGEGERISALLGTLAFIFGEDSLKSLKIHLNINRAENILFELFNKGNIHVFEYEGEEFNGTYDEERSLLTLYMYKKIIPEILEKYNEALAEDTWNPEIRRDFVEYVGNTLIDKVRSKLDDNQQLANNMANIQ